MAGVCPNVNKFSVNVLGEAPRDPPCYPPRVVYCQECGAENTSNARFCNMCGVAIAKPGEPGGEVVEAPPRAEPAKGGDAGAKPEDAGAKPSPDEGDPARTLHGHGLDASPAEAKEPEEVEPPKPKSAEAEESAKADQEAKDPEPSEERAAKPREPEEKHPPKTKAKRTEEPTPIVAGEENVWEAHSSDRLDISTVSLSAIGVKSKGKAWGLVVLAVAALVGLGALGMWIAMNEGDGAEPIAGATEPDGADETGEPSDPQEDPDEVMVGDPLPDGAEEPDQVVPGHVGPRRRPDQRSSNGNSGGSGSGGSVGEAWTSEGGGSGGSGGSGAGGSGAGGSGAGGSGAGGSGAGGSGSGGSGSGGSGSGGSGSGGSDIDWDAMREEQDVEMEMYDSRLGSVIRSYYMRRAAGCWDRETRNNQSVRGLVLVGLRIAADGSVSNTTVDRNTTGSTTLGRCLAAEVARWRLPPPPEGRAPLARQLPFSR